MHRVKFFGRSNKRKSSPMQQAGTWIDRQAFFISSHTCHIRCSFRYFRFLSIIDHGTNSHAHPHCKHALRWQRHHSTSRIHATFVIHSVIFVSCPWSITEQIRMHSHHTSIPSDDHAITVQPARACLKHYARIGCGVSTPPPKKTKTEVSMANTTRPANESINDNFKITHQLLRTATSSSKKEQLFLCRE